MSVNFCIIDLTNIQYALQKQTMLQCYR